MEKIVETKNCKQCSCQFDITDKDLEFYYKVSPVFKGKKCLIPTPTFCPDCRNQRRLSWRNEGKLYRRRCQLTGNEIVSIFSPDKEYNIYNRKDWWGDTWNALDYGVDYDDSRGFFEQYNELLKITPVQGSFITNDCINSEYGNHFGKGKDCYLIFASWICERTFYSKRLIETVNVFDSLDATILENSYQVVNSENNHTCFYILNSSNCRNSYFLFDCEDCSDCYKCYNLVGKKYYIENKEYEKSEYQEIVSERKKQDLLDGWNFLENIKDKAVNKNLLQVNCEMSLGDNIKNCKNCWYAYHFDNAENCKYVENGGIGCNNTMDGRGIGDNLDLALEIIDTGVGAYKNGFLLVCHGCSNTYYSINCYNSEFLFGCFGLKNQKYCIFNKQYTKEEYEVLVGKIITNMIEEGDPTSPRFRGTGWGEFFPVSMSPFGYNETVASEYYPLEKNKAMKQGFKWSDYETPFPKVEKIIAGNELPNDITQIPDDILNWAIKCERSGELFKILPEELNFYRKHGIPIPKRHFHERHMEREKLSNPKHIFDRKCDKCSREIKSVFSGDSGRIVYCEDCYNNLMY